MSRNTEKNTRSQEEDHLHSALAFGWCYLATPLSSNQIAVLLDQLLRRKLPEGYLRNILSGLEAEIRQQAFILLIRRYLLGNQQLRSATEDRNLEEIANQIEKSINAAIRIATFAIRDSILGDLKRFEDVDVDFRGMQMHPAFITHASELPLDMQRDVLIHLLREGVKAGSISISSAQMALKMIDYGINQTQMALELGVTRQAVNQRISNLSFVIKPFLDKLEFPILESTSGNTKLTGNIGSLDSQKKT